MQFLKFPSIEQFRKVVKTVSDRASFVGLDDNSNVIRNYNKPKPVINFTQTVKIHGTNAGIGLTADGKFFQQSRNRIIDAVKPYGEVYYDYNDCDDLGFVKMN